jgi:hypothetical protein
LDTAAKLLPCFPVPPNCPVGEFMLAFRLAASKNKADDGEK